MTWQSQLNADPLPWLLEADDPGVRYLALRDLAEHPKPAELRVARQQAHTEGPIAAVLKKLNKAGYWAAPGPGYNPKYRATVWSIILLAQLGASAETIRASRRPAPTCSITASPTAGNSPPPAPPRAPPTACRETCAGPCSSSGTRTRVWSKAFDWMARTVTGEGIAPITDRAARRALLRRQVRSDVCLRREQQAALRLGRDESDAGPGTLAEGSPHARHQARHRAGIDFFFSVDPADATYPSGWAPKPSGNWWKFGFPVFYITDLLQVAEALAALGYGGDPRLKRTLKLIRDKQDADGRWPLEYDYAGKTWVDFGAKKKPNKWVTLRALRVRRRLPLK